MYEIPTHFGIPLSLTAVVLILILLFYKRTFKSNYWKFWISTAVFCLIYMFIVGSALMIDIEIRNDLMQFDLNNDGIFSIEESTPVYKELMKRSVNDLGRNLSVYIGVIFSSILAVVAYLILWVFQRLK